MPRNSDAQHWLSLMLSLPAFQLGIKKCLHEYCLKSMVKQRFSDHAF